MIQKIVGISFNPTKNKDIVQGVEVKIFHDKDNKYSSKAIAVTYDDKLLGHIGEKGNEQHEEIFKVLPLKAKVHTVATLAKGEEFGKFREGEITHLEVEFKMATDSDGRMKSFNEDVELTFLDTEHRYIYKGEDLVSASTYKKRWIKEFDKESISRMCANAWGVTQKEVLGLWENGGNISADFGTVIHKALEHYEKYKVLGKMLQDKKDLPFNKALPSHPMLRDIVLDFTRNFTHKDDEILTEVLLTNVEKGICGQADRIKVTGKKKCRVEDYKININADKENKNIKFLGQMADLPKTKLSEYQIQLSIYARMLELSGWEVEGLTVYVYDEEGWRKFDMDILKLDF